MALIRTVAEAVHAAHSVGLIHPDLKPANIMWDGSGWQAVGGAGSISSEVCALLTDGDDLYVAGSFNDAGGVTGADCVARWDGYTWHVLGSGLDSSVNDLVRDSGGNLYAAGDFMAVGGQPGNNSIAVWDGSAWSTLGSGIDWPAEALACDGGLSLWIGGAFARAGGKPSARVARHVVDAPGGPIFIDDFESGNTGAWSVTVQ